MKHGKESASYNNKRNSLRRSPATERGVPAHGGHGAPSDGGGAGRVCEKAGLKVRAMRERRRTEREGNEI